MFRIIHLPPLLKHFFLLSIIDLRFCSKGTHDEILNFADKFGARDKFVWFEKGHVNGADTRPIYSFLKHALPNEDGTFDIRWNFAKFLVDSKGIPHKRYGSKFAPEGIIPDIEILLNEKEK